MDPLQIVTLVLGSSTATAVIGALLGEPLKAHLEKRSSDKERVNSAKFAALSLANALEDYARTCADVVARNDSSADPWSDEAGHFANIPKQPPYPENISWTALGVHETDAALSFRTRVELVRSYLSDYWEYADDQIFEATAESAAQIGMDARAHASRLRREMGLKPLAEDKFVWNYASTMQSYLLELKKKRDRAAARPDIEL